MAFHECTLLFWKYDICWILCSKEWHNVSYFMFLFLYNTFQGTSVGNTIHYACLPASFVDYWRIFQCSFTAVFQNSGRDLFYERWHLFERCGCSQLTTVVFVLGFAQCIYIILYIKQSKTMFYSKLPSIQTNPIYTYELNYYIYLIRVCHDQDVY